MTGYDNDGNDDDDDNEEDDDPFDIGKISGKYFILLNITARCTYVYLSCKIFIHQLICMLKRIKLLFLSLNYYKIQWKYCLIL